MLARINAEVENWLRDNNTTLEYLATKMGISQSYLSRILNGDKQITSPLLTNLCASLNLNRLKRADLCRKWIKHKYPQIYSEVMKDFVFRIKEAAEIED